MYKTLALLNETEAKGERVAERIEREECAAVGVGKLCDLEKLSARACSCNQLAIELLQFCNATSDTKDATCGFANAFMKQVNGAIA